MFDSPTNVTARRLRRRRLQVALAVNVLALLANAVALVFAEPESTTLARVIPVTVLVFFSLAAADNLSALRIMASEESLAKWLGKPFVDHKLELQVFADGLRSGVTPPDSGSSS